MEPAAEALSPALPWAAKDVEDAKAGDEGLPASVPAAEQSLTLQQVGLDIGSRMEVMWKVDKDDGTSDVRWWGATVASKAGTSDEGPPAYVLRYDAYEEFEEENVDVSFIAQHELRSQSAPASDGDDDEEGAAEDPLLFWRKAGEAWEPPAEEETAAGIMQFSADQTYSLQEVLKKLPDEQTLQAEEAEALAELEPSQQRQVVEGFRGWMDDLKAFLAAKVDMARESGDDNVTITPDAIEDFKAQMRTKRQRIDYGTGGGL